MDLTPELVARCLRDEPDPGPNPDFTPATEADLAALTDRLLAGRPGGPLWIVAYGSLIWSPGFEVEEWKRATVLGWHRSFCLELTRWRGSPKLPALMMALARGGRCNALIAQPPDDQAHEVVLRLVKREINVIEDLAMARWVNARTAEGSVRALVFWAGPSGKGILHGLPLDKVAWRLAHACGHNGSNAEYLFQTVAGLEAHGIRDRNLWRLQELVAAEVRSWPARPDDP